jgi:hypothetical protein
MWVVKVGSVGDYFLANVGQMCRDIGRVVGWCVYQMLRVDVRVNE